MEDALRTLGRMDLAPLFFDVDAALDAGGELSIALVRPTTLAGGADRCRFERRLRQDRAQSAPKTSTPP